MSGSILDGREFWDSLKLKIPSCMHCVHWHSGTVTCKAFPDRIPHEIFGGENNHHKEFPGDHGIQFERKGEQ